MAEMGTKHAKETYEKITAATTEAAELIRNSYSTAVKGMQGIDTLTIGAQGARPLRPQFMRPQLSHHSKIYALRSEIVYGSAG